MEGGDVIVRINVSGTFFQTLSSTLRKLGDCFFNQFGSAEIQPD
jgi:hypothetical protein